ncbi:FMN-binding negative transcriptional regulator [Paraglaciecola sp. 20A4]|uniref:FMN-binding negative transcriptional regulator n=1 Tax=Paraglaciecola sp. 20A4 TaxID=2687288 RepID=UPI00140A8F38|nr:FMN-binding negative transcriptional regulator [Paraglaciecola sp. 20A4]
MFIPNNMRMQGDKAIAQFINDHSFGILVSESLEATHIPFIFAPDEGENGALYGHLAKANPQCKQLAQENALVIFSGPHAYISPTWYETGPGVPTWNYSAVHCIGRASLLNEDDTVQIIDRLVAKYEPELLNNKVLMPQAYQDKLRQAVVGFKIIIDHVDAKEKLGQQRKSADQQGVFDALLQSTNVSDNQLADYMQHRKLGTGRAG